MHRNVAGNWIAAQVQISIVNIQQLLYENEEVNFLYMTRNFASTCEEQFHLLALNKITVMVFLELITSSVLLTNFFPVNLVSIS